MTLITGIKRLSVHDGDGIRTTIFLQGCPLRCKWCHNPENFVAKPLLAYKSNKCIGCGACVSVCPNGVHSFVDGRHLLDKTNCVACGKCAEVCLGQALSIYGRQITPQQLMETIGRDVIFYQASGGGVTISGGEPLCNVDFVCELQSLLKKQEISCDIDTCGYVPFECFEKVLKGTDVFLYDVKCIDEQLHIDGTGKSNKLILQNLSKLDDLGGKTEIRIPLIPQWNDNAEELKKIGEFVRSLKNCRGVCVLPYHAFAESKYASLDLPFTEFGNLNISLQQAQKILSDYAKVLE